MSIPDLLQRLRLDGLEETSVPIQDGQLRHFMANILVAAASVFKQLMETVFDKLIGTRCTHRIKKRCLDVYSDEVSSAVPWLPSPSF